MLGRVLALAYYLLALRNSRRGRHAAALAQLNAAIRYLPSWPHAYCNRAFAHQCVGDHESAIQDCDRAIRLAPSLAMAYFNRGISQKILLDFDSALEAQCRATELDPKFVRARGELGMIYACKHEHDLAISSLTWAIRLEPVEAGYYLERGYCQFCRGDFEAAAADFRRSLALKPNPYAALMCYLARERGGADAGGELAADARTLDGWPYPVIEFLLGSRTPDATLAAAPNSDARAEVYFYIGQWYLLKNNPAEADAALTQAMRTCPANFHEYIGAIAELRRFSPPVKS